MKINTSQVNDMTILKLEGNLCAYQAKILEELVKNLMETYALADPWGPSVPSRISKTAIPTLILDLSKVFLLDSTGLGALIRSYQRVTRKGGYVFLAGLHSEPRLVMDLTHTIRLFQVFESTEAAMACFKQIMFTQKQLKNWGLVSH